MTTPKRRQQAAALAEAGKAKAEALGIPSRFQDRYVDSFVTAIMKLPASATRADVEKARDFNAGSAEAAQSFLDRLRYGARIAAMNHLLDIRAFVDELNRAGTKDAGPHAFVGKDPKSCGKCGRPMPNANHSESWNSGSEDKGDDDGGRADTSDDDDSKKTEPHKFAGTKMSSCEDCGKSIKDPVHKQSWPPSWK